MPYMPEDPNKYNWVLVGVGIAGVLALLAIAAFAILSAFDAAVLR